MPQSHPNSISSFISSCRSYWAKCRRIAFDFPDLRGTSISLVVPSALRALVSRDRDLRGHSGGVADLYASSPMRSASPVVVVVCTAQSWRGESTVIFVVGLVQVGVDEKRAVEAVACVHDRHVIPFLGTTPLALWIHVGVPPLFCPHLTGPVVSLVMFSFLRHPVYRSARLRLLLRH
jgi:hypothetical protein